MFRPGGERYYRRANDLAEGGRTVRRAKAPNEQIRLVPLVFPIPNVECNVAQGYFLIERECGKPAAKLARLERRQQSTGDGKPRPARTGCFWVGFIRANCQPMAAIGALSKPSSRSEKWA